MGWAGGRFSPLLSPPLASGVVGRLPPGCCCRVGGRTGDRQAVSKPLASLLNESVFFFLLGPPGRRGKPGRRGDPGKSQVLVPKPRPGSLCSTRFLAGGTCPLPPHYSGWARSSPPFRFRPLSSRPQCPGLSFLGFLTSQFQWLSPLCLWRPPDLITGLRNFNH